MSTGHADLVTPVIHRNGTSREALLKGACEIGHALRVALGALYEYGPNQRDYYPDPPRWEAVSAQHARRVATVTALLAEMEAEAEAIADGEE